MGKSFEVVDSRRSARLPERIPIHYHVAPETRDMVRLKPPLDEMQGQTYDLSRGGVAFVAEHFLPVGTVLSIRLSPGRSRSPIAAKSIVRWLKTLESGKLMFGTEFLIAPSDIDDLIPERKKR